MYVLKMVSSYSPGIYVIYRQYNNNQESQELQKQREKMAVPQWSSPEFISFKIWIHQLKF